MHLFLQTLRSSPVLWLLILLPISVISTHTLCPSLCLCDSRALFVNCSGTNLSSIVILPPLATEFLDLSSCSLNTLPPLHNLWRLRTILLAQNKILQVGDGSWKSLQSLQILDLNGNKIGNLSVGFSLGLESLTHLVLAQNHLHCVPKYSFQQLYNLELLDLQGNLIFSLDSGAFRSLTKLRHLQLQNNKLQSLKNNDFSVLQRLEFLDLSGNQINNLPSGVFTPLHSLTFLNLQNNKLRHLRFQTLSNLPSTGTLLLLSSNPWECDCDLQRMFGKLRSLQKIYLQDGEHLNCAAPPALKGRPLKSLDTQLCVAETVTVLMITLTVAVTVVGAIVTAERSRKKSPRHQGNETCGQE
ncbi:reticulon-4 receptor-like 2 [Bufo gargarizans]|uniref:reticulon-4 receptor-like 2 n=1 Tax=Bufo gargarizans TaxID=30331 RepID=UPI001CF44363|nr:reticulon-4 receptor-like 2 [Bufo gargarizans]